MEQRNASPATSVFVRKVAPEDHEKYEDWLKSIAAALTDFPGYGGITILRPTSTQGEYVSMVQFNTTENLERWLASEARERCLEELRQIGIQSEEVSKLAGLDYWVSHTGGLRLPPPNWKMATLILGGLYPLVLVQGLLLGPLLARLPGFASHFISLAISVAIMVWIVLPLLSKLLAGWLAPRSTRSVSVSSDAAR